MIKPSNFNYLLLISILQRKNSKKLSTTGARSLVSRVIPTTEVRNRMRASGRTMKVKDARTLEKRKMCVWRMRRKILKWFR